MTDTKTRDYADTLDQYNGKWVGLYFIDDGTSLNGKILFDSIDEFNAHQDDIHQETIAFNKCHMALAYKGTTVCAIGNKINPCDWPTAISVIPMPVIGR